jgi:deazaflavin-dependent oxidoreductase (nitroreductase family)
VSGQPRSVLLNAFPAGDHYVVVGSNAGYDFHSKWYLNLKDNPNVTVEISGEQYSAIARDTEGEERDRLWAEVIEADPSYAGYEFRTERQIPVVVLERRS